MDGAGKYLSVIMVGRNDNYGGDFKSRLQRCITWTHHHLSLNKINAEIIFVNYNPLPESDIKDFIVWPLSNDFVDVKVLTISNTLHDNFVKYHKVHDVPVLEYPAKNAGIRRARGKFILCMNPDILIDERNFSYFKHLSEDKYFRLDRIDYDGEFEIDKSNSIFNCLGNYARLVWYKGSAYQCSGITENRYFIYKFLKNIDNLWKANNIKLRWLLNILKINSYSHNVGFKLHTNASGDFLLMNKAAWNKIKGYRENTPISLHNDSLMVVQAHALGLKERILKYPAFHKEHDRRYDSMEQEKYRAIFLEYNEFAQRMIKQKHPIVFNDNNWGFAQFELPLIKL